MRQHHEKNILRIKMKFISCFLTTVGGCLLYIADPELIKFVASNSHKFYRPDFVARNIPSISAGLFASNGKAHARQKRMIGPAFTSKYLKGFLGIFKENVDNLVKVSD